MASKSAPVSVPDSSTLYISQAEYDALLLMARQYANLRQNLLNGGLDEYKIELLSTRVASVFPAGVSAALSVSSSDNGSWTDHLKELSSTPRAISASLMGSRYLDPSPARHGYFAEPRQHALRRNGREPTVRSEDDASSDDSHVDRRSRLSINEGGSTGHFPRPQFERQTMRSVLLCHLPEAVTHADITAVVRGGLVLDVFVRSKDKTASVSFLHQEDARAFYEYVRKNDLYINQKRVDIRWSDRQYILPGHVANKIGVGATRNLVIRYCDPSHTEESIREDLEHIHNLTVVKISFLGRDCFISINSVANAMYARSCMMSRLKYKNSRIEWDVDECAQSLVRMPLPLKTAPTSNVPNAPMKPPVNRFQILNVDDGGYP